MGSRAGNSRPDTRSGPTKSAAAPAARADTITGDGYTFDTATGALTVSTNAGATAWRNATAIDANATARYNAITRVVLQTGVTAIGTQAFQNCNNLTSVTFPASGLTAIGSQAFSYCRGLTSVTFPASGLLSIGNNAFYYSDALAGPLVIPGGVVSIGKRAFSYTKITSVSLPDSLTSVGDYAFDTCNITDITFPANSLPAWGWQVFGNNDMTAITIPTNITTLGDAFFLGCKRLAAVTLPDTLTVISLGAFADCTALKTIDLPASVTTIGASAFAGSGLTSLPSMPSVTDIGGETFRNCDGLTGTIVIPDRVTALGETRGINTVAYVFSGCDNITGVTLGAGITRIPHSCFRACKRLLAENITIPAVITSIDYNAFYDCDSLTALPAMPGVIELEYGAFSYCDGLVVINIPDTLRIVGNATFMDCKGLQKVSIPATGIQLGNGRSDYYNTPGVFDGCSILNNVVIPDGTIIYDTDDGSFPSELFRDCTSLTNVTLPADLAYISAGMFRGCTSLSQINLPAGIKYIGNNAFEKTNLSGITLPGCVSSIGRYAFAECQSLQPITIPAAVTVIGDYAFYKCPAFTTVTLPPYLARIGANVFRQSGLTSVVIPAGCVEIGAGAFSGCDALTSVTIPPSVTTFPTAASQMPFLQLTSSGGFVYNVPGDYSSGYKILPDITLTVAAGSAAETYATANSIPFVNYTPAHVPVTDIAGTPVTAKATVTYSLLEFSNMMTGNLKPVYPPVILPVVLPSDASCKRIVWSVKDAGTANAGIYTYNTTRKYYHMGFGSAGTAVLTATIAGGGADGADYTKDFTFTVDPVAFVAVTDITGVPTTATAGTSLPLAATVTPADATNQTITWSVKTAGTTGAAITSGNIFTATAAGSATITATILNGAGTGSTNYTKDFTITVNPSGSGGGGGTTPDVGTPGLLASPAGVVVAAGTPARVYVSDPARHTVSVVESGTLRLLAGKSGESGALNGTGTAARFNQPRGLAINRAGVLLVADTGNDHLRALTAAGTVTDAIATGPDALLDAPSDVAALDASTGESYIADTGNHLIKKIAANGAVTIIAGNGVSGTDNGALLTAKFNAPAGVAVDVSGSHLYIADTGNHAIRLINLANNTVTTFAGAPGASGAADGPYADARFNAPADLVVDGNGDVFVADTGNSLICEITVISGTRLVRTLAGGTPAQGTGAIAAAALPAADGVFPTALPAAFPAAGTFPAVLPADDASPTALPAAGAFPGAFPADGTFPAAMIAPAEAPASASTESPSFAPAAPGFLDGTGADSRFDHPRALALASDGTLYIADTGNAALRTIAPDATATVSTIPLRPGPAITGTVSGTGGTGSTGGNDTGGSDGKSNGGGGGGGGGGAPSLLLLVALTALTALRVKARRVE